MLTIVYSSHKGQDFNNKFSEYLIKSSGLDTKKIQVLAYENYDEFSLTKIYNLGLKEANNNFIVFCHNDIRISENWGRRLIKQLERNEYGIIGVAGTTKLEESGRWWETPKNMYGIVEHDIDRIKHTNFYSKDLGNKIKNVVVVDGVFFAVNRKLLKHNFDESFGKFHFYDISFCLENFLSGVKVGVAFNFRLTHQSGGAVNEEWEQNRIKFVEKYKDILPISVQKDDNSKAPKILISCLSLKEYTGSELYNVTLAKELVKRNYEVSMCAYNVGEPLLTDLTKSGIKVYNMENPPAYKMGDNVWALTSSEGRQVSQKGVLYRVTNEKFDIIHSSHTPMVKAMTELYPDTPIISSIHSEIIELEKPYISPNVKKYIAIRPEIKDFLIREHNITESDIEIIYNPIDDEKFSSLRRKDNVKQPDRILFVGTIDYLRKNAMIDLIRRSKEENKEFWILGKENGITYKSLLEESGLNDTSHVKYIPPTNKVQTYLGECGQTAGILLGRTTIEGWFAGKEAIIYDVDSNGNIISVTEHKVPKDLDKFKLKNVVNQIVKIYEQYYD